MPIMHIGHIGTYHRSFFILLINRNFTKHLWRRMRVCIAHCSIALLQEHESWTMINKYKTTILMCSFDVNRKIMESIKLFKKQYWGLLMVKRAAKSFVFKTFRYYLQNGAALIMGYLNIARTTKIFHQVALLATMCFCLISSPE